MEVSFEEDSANKISMVQELSLTPVNDKSVVTGTEALRENGVELNILAEIFISESWET